MPRKVFVAGEEATAADVNTYLMDQTVARFTTAAQRTTQLATPVLNQLSIRDDRPGYIERWNGTAWVDLAVTQELAYAQSTVSKTVTSSVETSADLVVAAPAVTFDGTTAVIVEVFAPAVIPASAAGALMFLLLYLDGASLGRIAAVGTPAAGQHVAPVLGSRRLTPAAGSRQYSFAAINAGGTGTVQGGTGLLGNYAPAYIRITRA